MPLDHLAERRTAFAQAYNRFRHGDIESTLPIFAALVRRYPQLADYHLYFVGVINARLQHRQAAEAALRRVLYAYPPSVQAPAAALELGKLLAQSGRADEGRLWLQSVLAASDARISREARLALAEEDERSGAIPAAYEGFMQVRRTAPGTAAGRTAKEHVRRLRTTHAELVPSGARLLNEARLLIAEHDYATANNALMRLLRGTGATGAGVERADVLQALAGALYGLGQTEQALDTWRLLVERYPGSPTAPEALFRRASVLWNLDRDREALQAFVQFRRHYGDDRRAPEVLYAIGRIHQRAGHAQRAIASYARLARRYPQSRPAPESRWRIGWIQYLGRDPSAATATFSALARRARSPRRRNEATYWQARAYEKAGHAAAAKRLYRAIIDRDADDYYALWAERRLGLPSRLPAPQGPGIDPARTDSFPSLQATLISPFHVERWQELKAAGVYPLARRELAAIARDHRREPALMAYLIRAYQTVDGYAAALRLLSRLDDSVALSPFERARLSYPLAFWPIVRREARTHAVDPLLVEALMRQESLFDPASRSSAGAEGLMQLMPTTVTRWATPQERPIAPADLTQPELNIRLGVRELAALLARFQGDMLKALAAYNAGESAVEKWERRAPQLEADEFIECISYRETRDYVKRVVSNYRTYRRLYGAQASEPGTG
ncbi:MAG: transglycosylase SLT domain-containing protein [Candidatus Binatia bacterium]